MYLPYGIILEKVAPPLEWVVGRVGVIGGYSREVRCLDWTLAVVLACTGRLEMPAEVGPICVAVGICPGFC